MTILSIGANDHEYLSKLIQQVVTEPVEFYHIKDILSAPNFIMQNQVSLFICDLKFGEGEVRSLVSALNDDPSACYRGVFISDRADYDLSIYGLNTHLINDYILRPYDKARVEEMWRRNCRGTYRHTTTAV